MNLLHNDIKVELGDIIRSTIEELGFNISMADIYHAIGRTPNIESGHFAFPAFSLAKVMRKGPPVIAKMIAEKIPENDLIAEINTVGPYMNFSLKTEAFGRLVCNPILGGSYFQKPMIQDSPRTMIEYSQPNTHKELHVGHMRNIALGDALIRMHRYCGYEIVSSTFPGDVGTHVAKCLWYMKHVNTEPIPTKGKGAWLGQMYSNGALLLNDIKGTEQEAEAREIMTEILKQLEVKEGEYFDIWKETRQWSVDLMHQVYDWAGVKFDVWYWESDVDADSVKFALEHYNKGFFKKSKGAVGIDLEKYNLGFAMVLKGDGSGLYLTKDLELARRKFQDYGIEKNIYIVDKRQERHFKQVFKILELLGFEQAKNCFHLKYDFVRLPTGPMSSREGTIIPIMKLIARMEGEIYGEYLKSQVDNSEISESEAREIASVVAKGAIKYGMVKIDTQKEIIFNLEEWIKISGNSGPYQQYVCARISRLLEKQGYDPNGEIDWSLLVHPAEIELLIKVSGFNDAMLSATQKYQPNQVTNYLYDLSKSLNVFYNDVNIKDTEDSVLKNTRMALLEVIWKVESRGLALLGIEIPKKM